VFTGVFTGASASPSVTVPTSQPGGKFAITVNAQAQAASSASLALCQVSLDGTTLDVQQVTVPATATTGGRSVSLVGTGTASAAAGGGVVLVQCSNDHGTFSSINVQATQLDALN
jgi:hypothetical protein